MAANITNDTIINIIVCSRNIIDSINGTSIPATKNITRIAIMRVGDLAAIITKDISAATNKIMRMRIAIMRAGDLASIISSNWLMVDNISSSIS